MLSLPYRHGISAPTPDLYSTNSLLAFSRITGNVYSIHGFLLFLFRR